MGGNPPERLSAVALQRLDDALVDGVEAPGKADRAPWLREF
jgi:hypothetical protein